MLLPFLSMRELAFHDSLSIQRNIAYNVELLAEVATESVSGLLL